MNNKPIFAHKVKVDRPWTPLANVAETFKRQGWVPPTQAAEQAAKSQPEVR